jgi:hypothetical protein
MEFDFGSGFGDIDLSTIADGSTDGVPLDVSNGAPDMQPSTPTGNGSGVFLDSTSQNRIFGGLEKVLDYALQRDQQRFALDSRIQYANAVNPYGVRAPAPPGTISMTPFVWLGVGLLAFMAFKGAK